MKYLGRKKTSILLLLAMITGSFMPVLAGYETAAPVSCQYENRSGRYIVDMSGIGSIRADKSDTDAGLTPIAVNIPQGVYSVTLVSGNPSLQAAGQTDQGWYLILGDDSGNTVGVTPAIDDIPEGDLSFHQVVDTHFVVKDSVSWSIAFHNAYPSQQANIVTPVCAVFDSMNSSEGGQPFVTTQSAEGVTAGSAVLHGSVDTNGMATEKWFEWGYRSTALDHKTDSVGDSSSSGNFETEIDNLHSDMTYYYRAAGRNADGVAHGLVMSFTTHRSASYAKPTATTDFVSSVSSTSAFLHAVVNPEGLTTDIWFEYGKNQLEQSTEKKVIDNGDNDVTQNYQLVNLDSNTVYYYRIVAQNSKGTSYGDVRSFKTDTDGASQIDVTSIVLTKLASDITATTGTLHAVALPGNYIFTQGWFEWGDDSSLSHKSPVIDLGSDSTMPYSQHLVNLDPHTKYYYRAVIQTENGLYRGEVLSFTTTNTSGTGSSAGGSTSSGTTGGSTSGKPSTGTGSGSQTPTVSPKPSPKPSTTPSPTPTPTNNGVSTSTSPLKLTITTENGDSVGRGQIVSYTVTAKNTTTKKMTNVRLTVVLPSGVTYVSDAASPFSSAADVLVHDLGNLDPQQEKSLSFKAQIGTDAKDGDILTTTIAGSYEDSTGQNKDSTAYVLNTVDQSKDVSNTNGGFSDRFKNLFSNKLTAGIVGTIIVLLIILVILYILERRARNGSSSGNR